MHVGTNFADVISDLERMRQAAVQLSALIEHTVTTGRGWVERCIEPVCVTSFARR